MAVYLEATIKRFIGLSTDDKPLLDTIEGGVIPPGSSFLEADTGEIYRWEGAQWRKPTAAEDVVAEDQTAETLAMILLELHRLRRLVELATA